MTTPAPVRFLSWNVERGRRIEDACRWITGLTVVPDVVCWQELQPGDEKRVAELLEMSPYVAEPRAYSTNRNGIFVREDGAFVVDEVFEHPPTFGHAPANVTLRLRGDDGELSARALCLFSVHASFYSPTIRLIEAEFLTRFAQPGWITAVMGDFNDAPAGARLDLSRIGDRAYYAHRTYPLVGGERRIDTRADHTLCAAGYVDAGAWAAENLTQETDPLAATAGYRRSDQGGMQRVDRTYVTRPLTPAISGYRVGALATDPELAGISDHLPVMLELDRAKLARAMNRPASTAA